MAMSDQRTDEAKGTYAIIISGLAFSLSAPLPFGARFFHPRAFRRALEVTRCLGASASDLSFEVSSSSVKGENGLTSTASGTEHIVMFGSMEMD